MTGVILIISLVAISIWIIKTLITFIMALFAKPPNEDLEKAKELEVAKQMDKIVHTLKNEIIMPMERRDLVTTTLQKIGCQPYIDDDDNICFKYQGSDFYIDADNNYMIIDIWCTWVYNTSLDDEQIVKEAVNYTNLNSFTKYIYAVDKENNTIAVHLKTQILFIPEIPDLDNYLASALNLFFTSFQDIFKIEMNSLRMEQSKAGMN